MSISSVSSKVRFVDAYLQHHGDANTQKLSRDTQFNKALSSFVSSHAHAPASQADIASFAADESHGNPATQRALEAALDEALSSGAPQPHPIHGNKAGDGAAG